MNTLFRRALATLLLPLVAQAQTTLIERSLDKLSKTPPACPDSFDFIVTSDSNTLKPLQQSDVFRRFIQEFNTLKPSLVVQSGDLVLGGDAEGVPPQWDLFLDVIGKCQPPYFCAPGNHDVSDPATEKLWTDRIGPLHYSFRYGNSLFIVLDAEELGSAGRISDGQAAWVRKELEASDAANVFVFLHRPFFAHHGDPVNADQEWQQNWANMAEVFKGHPVRAVFAGHEHMYRDCGVRDGVHYVICAGGAAYGMNAPAEEGGFNHYLLVRVRGTEVGWSVIKPGSVLPENAASSLRADELYNVRNKWINASEIEVPLNGTVDQTLNITVSNPHAQALKSSLQWNPQPGWTITPMQADFEAAPNGTTELKFQVRTQKGEDTRFPVPYFTTRYDQTQYGPAVDVKQELKLVPRARVAKAPANMTIDGNLSEWSGAQMARLIYPVGFDGKNKQDLDCEVGFMWDEKALYLAVRTQDNEHYQPYAGDIVWSADNVEMFLNRRWSWGLTLTNKGIEAFLYRGEGVKGVELDRAVNLSVKREGTQTIYEAAFPPERLPALKLAPGNDFRFNMLMNDMDPSGPEKERHWLQLVPEHTANGGPNPSVKFVLEK